MGQRTLHVLHERTSLSLNTRSNLQVQSAVLWLTVVLVFLTAAAVVVPLWIEFRNNDEPKASASAVEASPDRPALAQSGWPRTDARGAGQTWVHDFQAE